MRRHAYLTRMADLRAANVTQIHDDCHQWLTKFGVLTRDQEARADAAIAEAKAQLRELCDRSRGPEPVEVRVYPLSVFCIAR